MTAAKIAVDLSTKIGGRLVQPAFPVVDSSIPSATEVSFQESLMKWAEGNIPLESTEGIQTRERVLSRMGELVRTWIRSVCVKRGLPASVIEAAGGQLFTSGSYRLGVHEPGADIDCILVAPNICSKQDFFGTIAQEEGAAPLRDPESLAERIRTHPDVTNFVPVEGAAVPILTFDWEGINIDLLFARLNSPSVPPDFDIDNDAVLDGVDSATEKSLNGPRVTNLIAALVGGTRERYDTFLAVVRCVRKYFKIRGLYSNKMGYFGGVNINIAVALCIQLYPTAPPASLLRKFFLVFKTWRWPNPVLLTKPHDAGYGLPVWQPGSVQTARQVAPMITPAYPAMNSTLAISRQTLQILHEEFSRGHAIMDRLWKQHSADPAGDLDWDELFRPSDFFIAYPHYLSLCIVGPTQEDAQAWTGFVESRLRKLVSDMLGRSLPLTKIQLWPKKFEMCVADHSALLTLAQRQNCCTYFIGFQVDTLRMRGDQLNVELQLSHFRDWELARFQPLVPGMDLLAKVFEVKRLPQAVFEVYEGGKAGAMKRRRQLRDADPKYQERKRIQKLNQLKAKMEEIQRRKDEKEAQREETVRKRKRSVGDEEDDLEEMKRNAIKLEAQRDQEIEEVAERQVEETNQLESALDNMLDANKTREEAEEDRERLLKGDDEISGEDEYVLSDDEEIGYTGDRLKANILVQPKQTKRKPGDIRMLPLEKDQEEALKKMGYNLVSDADEEADPLVPYSAHREKVNPPVKSFKINFKTQFDIVELDANGRVIDKGDDDFSPSHKWVGRKAGFEFKLGERGLGYYRTGKKVVVPSNMAY